MENNKNPLVCFFDSGIGGLNLLYECVKKLPRVDFVYLSDSKRMPYGNLKKEDLVNYTFEEFEKINALSPTAAVVACNTVTAECISLLRQTYSFPIVGVQPAVKPAVNIGGKVVVLTTCATAKSKSFNSLLKECSKPVEVYPLEGLANYIEDNVFKLTESEVIKHLPKTTADCVVLGCTHYAYVKETIAEFYRCMVLDGVEGCARRLCEILRKDTEIRTREQKIEFLEDVDNKNKSVFNFLLKKYGF